MEIDYYLFVEVKWHRHVDLLLGCLIGNVIYVKTVILQVTICMENLGKQCSHLNYYAMSWSEAVEIDKKLRTIQLKLDVH